MSTLSYREAVKLSRNFKNRSLDETKLLYETIQEAVAKAQKKDGKESDSAIAFLTEVYEPYVKKIAGKYYPYVGQSLEFEDVLQEVYVIFLILIYKYDQHISSFSYYINFMLPQYMNVWLQKLNSQSSTAVDIKIVEATICHPALDTSDKVFDYYDALILEKEYVAFIDARSEKSSRSKTVKEVCNRIFLGDTTCSELAQDLGISYHAVYEIVNKIKKELRFFFNSNQFAKYIVTSTGDYASDKFVFKYYDGRQKR